MMSRLLFTYRLKWKPRGLWQLHSTRTRSKKPQCVRRMTARGMDVQLQLAASPAAEVAAAAVLLLRSRWPSHGQVEQVDPWVETAAAAVDKAVLMDSRAAPEVVRRPWQLSWWPETSPNLSKVQYERHQWEQGTQVTQQDQFRGWLSESRSMKIVFFNAIQRCTRSSKNKSFHRNLSKIYY